MLNYQQKICFLFRKEICFGNTTFAGCLKFYITKHNKMLRISRKIQKLIIKNITLSNST